MYHRFRHRIAAWDGEVNGENISMFTSAPVTGIDPGRSLDFPRPPLRVVVIGIGSWVFCFVFGVLTGLNL